ncbi:SDR family oxidoreductase [Gordonia terrae]|uniref:SDR family oxidoreductase n=1 Tax=Gordonia hongkongensis TaxID=1701090 RepID=UPI0022B2B507|nr:SDR family oxidoreductase [Gordonia terrae]
MTSAEQCVIVGATGAMGTAISERLVSRGLRVLAVGRDEDALAHLADTNALIEPCAADIGSDGAVDIIAGAITGPVRMALFAAGLPVKGSIDSIDPSAFSIAANIKTGGVVRLLHAIRDHTAKNSRFVAIAGSLGIEPGPLDAGPGTANAALLNLMRQISLMYGPRGMTTHTIAPGPVDTPRLRSFVDREATETGRSVEEIWDRYVARTSLGRLPTLAEIAWLVETLLAPEASVLHGAVLAADGGVRRGII